MKKVKQHWTNADLVSFAAAMDEAGWDVELDQAEGEVTIGRMENGIKRNVLDGFQIPIGNRKGEGDWIINFSALLLAALFTAMNGKGDA